MVTIMMSDVMPKIEALDKDDIYFKQTNQNLKCKLWQMINALSLKSRYAVFVGSGLKRRGFASNKCYM